MNKTKIPTSFSLGGQDININFVPALGTGSLGVCSLAAGEIKIATTFGEYEQSESSIFNTFWHETVHAILDTMGELELTQNEKFVSCFAGFLCNVLQSAKYKEDQTTDETKTA